MYPSSSYPWCPGALPCQALCTTLIELSCGPHQGCNLGRSICPQSESLPLVAPLEGVDFLWRLIPAKRSYREQHDAQLKASKQNAAVWSTKK